MATERDLDLCETKCLADGPLPNPGACKADCQTRYLDYQKLTRAPPTRSPTVNRCLEDCWQFWPDVSGCEQQCHVSRDVLDIKEISARRFYAELCDLVPDDVGCP